MGVGQPGELLPIGADEGTELDHVGLLDSAPWARGQNIEEAATGAARPPP